MLSNNFAVVGACLGFSATLVYAVAAWNGRVVPNRVTWSLWAVIPLIIFAASVSNGGGLQSLLPLAAGLGPAVVIIVVLTKRQASYWKISRLDVCCGILSLLAIGLWVVTRDGTYAIYLSLVADLAAAFPTFIKSYKEPASESASVYLLFMVASVTVLLATKHWTAANAAFPLYAAIMSFVLCLLIMASRRVSRLKHRTATARD